MHNRTFAFIAAIALVLHLSNITFSENTKIFPPNAAVDVSPDSPLVLSFSDGVALSGHGKITIVDVATNTPVETIDTSSALATQSIGGVPNFKYYPVTFSSNEATIHPKNNVLAYGKLYRVAVEGGVFKNDTGAEQFIEWTFTTKRTAPAPGAAKLVIATDGSGDFATLQGALDFLPDNSVTPTTLYLKKGTYVELVCVTNKHNLTIIGEDRQLTTLQYANNNNVNTTSDMHIYHRGLFIAHRCNNLTVTNLTLRNSTPQGGSQAEALILNGTGDSQAVVSHVSLFSYQDTLQINGQAYVNDCSIEGDVDFMWGNGPTFFENCECKGLRSNAYYTQIRNPQTNHGFVYYHCTFDVGDGSKNLYLSRIEPARFPYSEVVLMDCTVIPGAVSGVAWKLDSPKGIKTSPTTEATSNLHFWEFNSHSPDNVPVDTSGRLAGSRQLKLPEDARLVKNYSDPVFVLGGQWDPRKSPGGAVMPGAGNP